MVGMEWTQIGSRIASQRPSIRRKIRQVARRKIRQVTRRKIRQVARQKFDQPPRNQASCVTFPRTTGGMPCESRSICVPVRSTCMIMRYLLIQTLESHETPWHHNRNLRHYGIRIHDRSGGHKRAHRRAF
jgi:hypothetical protein